MRIRVVAAALLATLLISACGSGDGRSSSSDAGDTVSAIIDDLVNGRLLSPAHPTQDDAAALVAARAPGVVSWADWLQIDQRERERGEPDGRPRRKFATLDEMLAVLGR